MIVELAKHIENLLLENDCVIIPGFGGFIVQYIPARRIDEEGIFLPPYRTVGFNPQLNLNDGLLIQSYMQAHDINYPEASRLVDDAVMELREQLSEKGKVNIHGVGKLLFNIENTIEFSPNEDGVFSPYLYGLSSFEMSELAEETPFVFKPSIEETTVNKKKHNTLVIRINRTWLNSAVAAVAAVLLFFLLSTQVDNTYVEPENYASFGDAGLFDRIRSQSAATSLVKTSESKRLQGKKSSLANAPSKSAVKANHPEPLKEVSVEKELAAVPEKKEEKVETSSVVVKEKEAMVSKEEKQTDKVSSPIIESSLNKKKETVQTTPISNTPKEKVAKQVHYHIIVASVTNMADAEKTIQYFTDKGYPGGTIVEGDGRVRIAIASSTDRKTVDAKWTDLRKIELFQNAWILTSRDK